MAVQKPMRGQVIKIFEDTVNGKYVVEVHDATGTGNVLSSKKFTDADLGVGGPMSIYLKAVLPGFI